MEHGRFLSNVIDPKSKMAKARFTFSNHAYDCGPDAMALEWQRHLDYIKKNVVKRPQATEKYTIEQLEERELIGIYKSL